MLVAAEGSETPVPAARCQPQLQPQTTTTTLCGLVSTPAAQHHNCLQPPATCCFVNRCVGGVSARLMSLLPATCLLCLQKQWMGLIGISCFFAFNLGCNNISLLSISLSLNQVIR